MAKINCEWITCKHNTENENYVNSQNYLAFGICNSENVALSSPIDDNADIEDYLICDNYEHGRLQL